MPTSVVVRKRPWKSVYSERFKLEKNWRKELIQLKHLLDTVMELHVYNLIVNIL